LRLALFCPSRFPPTPKREASLDLIRPEDRNEIRNKRENSGVLRRRIYKASCNRRLNVAMLGTSEGPVKVAINSALNLSALEHFARPQKTAKAAILRSPLLQPGGIIQASNPFLRNVEQTRERIRNMSDLELRKFGQAARNMADPGKNFGTPNPAFQIQLDEAGAKWRRRYPANPDGTARPPRM
jgi:hypothetical protein